MKLLIFIRVLFLFIHDFVLHYLLFYKKNIYGLYLFYQMVLILVLFLRKLWNNIVVFL